MASTIYFVYFENNIFYPDWAKALFDGAVDCEYITGYITGYIHMVYATHPDGRQISKWKFYFSLKTFQLKVFSESQTQSLRLRA